MKNNALKITCNLETKPSYNREHRLYAKWRKCDFYRDRIQYLDHIISEEGISMDPEKFEAIMNWPTPINVIVVRSLWDFQDTTGDSLKDSPRLHIQSLLCKRRE